MQLEVARLATPFTARVDVAAATGVALEDFTTFGGGNVAATLACRGFRLAARARSSYGSVVSCFGDFAPSALAPARCCTGLDAALTWCCAGLTGLVAAPARCCAGLAGLVAALARRLGGLAIRSRSVGGGKLALLERGDQ